MIIVYYYPISWGRWQVAAYQGRTRVPVPCGPYANEKAARIAAEEQAATLDDAKVVNGWPRSKSKKGAQP